MRFRFRRKVTYDGQEEDKVASKTALVHFQKLTKSSVGVLPSLLS